MHTCFGLLQIIFNILGDIYTAQWQISEKIKILSEIQIYLLIFKLKKNPGNSLAIKKSPKRIKKTKKFPTDANFQEFSIMPGISRQLKSAMAWFGAIV